MLSLLYATIFLCVLAFQGGKGAAGCTAEERDALLHFKASITNFNTTLWPSNQPCCSWFGVTCAPSSNNVLSLSLPHLSLHGSIPSSLRALHYLQTLNITDNRLHGPIPPELGSLAALQSLDLSLNNLSGPISFLGSLKSLLSANLSANSFTGSLPSFENLTSLEKFSVAKNSLEGAISFSICAYSTDIRILDLSSNNFSKLVVAGLHSCTVLQVINVSHNHLSGSIPNEIFSLGSLTQLSMNNNDFRGNLSNAVGNLSNITELSLSFNSLSGSIPRNLSSCRRLKILALNSNNFSGIISLNFKDLQSLRLIDLSVNQLNGNIPPEISNCAALESLNLAKNHLTGQIPPQFNNLKNLTILSLSSNNLNGSLSAVIGCNELISLILSKNPFREPLSQNISGFRKLQILALGNMHLTGKIPPWIKDCKNLQVLDLSWNKLDGALPEWIGASQHLFYLDLSNNSFGNTIPPELFKLQALITVDNETGLQPIANSLAIKHLNSPLLQYNQVTAFPPAIYLSHNRLVGSIPLQVGNLRNLLKLDLSYNNLTGTIPKTLANATHLETLDLSENRLTGHIPLSLQMLTFLSNFNVSYNNLSGQIPVGNQFSTFSSESFEGNQGLCGQPLNITCNSQGAGQSAGVLSTASHHRNGKTIATISSAISAGLILLTVLTFLLLRILFRAIMVHHGNDSFRGMDTSPNLSEALSLTVQLFHGREKLTVSDLFKATNNFDSANIIGCGGFGLVYRADLGDGSKLAIKKLTGDGGQMEREFRAEIDTLSKAQHKNLVSLQGFFHIGNNKLLIYSYMENGSLDYWLHEKVDGGTCLDWPIRLRIAQGAAQGLAYLHEICNPHIVHRDIKSSNILLDEKFEAHLADFGLARLMMSTDTHVTTELVGTLGYIPPEYAHALNATLKGDIYSFGVVLLELLTGKRPVDVCKAKGAGDLVTWVQEIHREGKSEEIFDTLLCNKGDEEEMLQVLDVACLCINRDPLKRPTINDVVFWLDRVGQGKQTVE